MISRASLVDFDVDIKLRICTAEDLVVLKGSRSVAVER
jgi:hypothetical protein